MDQNLIGGYEFKRENKYLVLKWADIEYLDYWKMEQLKSIVNWIRFRRKEEGKKENSYVVVNEDEPYAEKVWELIKAEEERKYGPKLNR